MLTLAFAQSNEIKPMFPKEIGINAVDRQSPNSRVLGGTIAPESTFRTLANLVIVTKRSGSPDDAILCTGTTLNRRWLLTASHCFFPRGGFQVSIEDSYAFVGQSDATLRINNTNLRPHRFVRYLTHKNYRPDRVALGNDIALIFLDRPIPSSVFQNVRLSPRRSTDPQGVAAVQVAGYGLVDNPITPDTKVKADLAMQANVTLQTFAECNRRVLASLASVVDERELVCSVPRPNTTGQSADVCSGDSGGPIFRVIGGRIEQFGITSFATTLVCAAPNNVNYYTRVSFFRRDIRQGRRMNFASWNVVNA